MKYRIRIEEVEYEVEVGDLSSRPIVATVDGEAFQVWPATDETPQQNLGVAAPEAEPSHVPTPSPRPSRRTTGPAAAPSGTAERSVYAPIPGVIDSLCVHPGDSVIVGQELCVVEAMKAREAEQAAA